MTATMKTLSLSKKYDGGYKIVVFSRWIGDISGIDFKGNLLEVHRTPTWFIFGSSLDNLAVHTYLTNQITKNVLKQYNFVAFLVPVGCYLNVSPPFKCRNIVGFSSHI